MALFKIFKGNQTDNLLNSNATGYRVPTDGYAYYDTSTKLFYIDADYNNNGTITRAPINAAHAGIAGSALNGIFYGICSTPASTKAKVATLIDNTGFALTEGTIVLIKFTNASAANTMTLNVDSTGAKTLYQYGTTLMNSGTTTTGWIAGAVVPFVYTGTAWQRFYWSNTAVTQAYSATNNSYPLLMSATAGISSTGTRGDTTAILNNQIYANPNTGILTTKGLETNSIKFENGCEIRSNAINNFYFRVQQIERNAAGKPVDAQGNEKTEDDKNDFVALGTYINTVVATDKALRPPTNNSGKVDLGDSEALWRNVYTKTVILSQDPQTALEAATKQYVDNSFAASDAMIFKGILNGAASTSYTPAADRGHTYKVATAGKINGINVEVGDILICTNDSTAAATSSNVNTIKNNWVIVQTNLDGAVIGPAGGVDDGNIAVFDGASGHIIKKGIIDTKNVVKTITFNGGTTPTLGDNISADDITNWSQGTLPSLSINTVSCDDITSWTPGSVTTAAVVNGVLTITTGTASSLSYTPRSIGSASNWGAGTLPSLSYTSRSIPNVTNVGTIATLTTESQSVVTSIS